MCAAEDHPSSSDPPARDPAKGEDLELVRKIAFAAHRVIDAIDSGRDPMPALAELRGALGRG